MNGAPPADIAAEVATLSGCMQSRDVALDVSEVLRAEDFYTPKHETIYESIQKLLASGAPTDVVSVVDHLVQRGELARVGGADYVHSIVNAIPVAIQAQYHAAIVSDKATRRRIMEVSARVLQQAHTGDVNSLIELGRTGYDQAAGLQRQPLAYVGDLIDDVVDMVGKPQPRYATPWPVLTDILGGGFRPGALYVVAARPGIGKTALALMMATALVEHGPVAFSSMEMPREELTRRIIAQGVRMPHHLLESPSPLPEIWKMRIEQWKATAPFAIALNDRATVTSAEIRAFARNVRAPSGRLAGVVTDYLQLMPGMPGTARQEIVAENARQHKIMAMEMNCPVILLSQLNRDPEKRIDKKPQLSDLRESGAIEQDADVVILVHRDPSYDQGPMDNVPRPIPIGVNVAKNRHGPTLDFELQWEGSQMRAF